MRYSTPTLKWLFVQSFVSSLPVTAQFSAPPAALQLNTFNSSFALSDSQIAAANFTPAEVPSANNAINYERSQSAGGLVSEDAFYTLPPIENRSTLAPGTPLKVEHATNITAYSLQPNLALSRIMYTTLNLNGSLVPASAYILWPFSPRSFPSVSDSAAPAVVWVHPTWGYLPQAAPSKHRSLANGDAGPFPLAEAGYVVVSPDYAGLGVGRGFDGEEIAHQYLSSTASANDAIYAFQAARQVFSHQISENYVVMGQSQGGGVAWGYAELMAKKPDLSRGYLGSIAVSPTTQLFKGSASFVAPFVGLGMSSVFPDFKLEQWLTPLGLGRVNVYKEIQGTITSGLQFMLSIDGKVARDGFNETWEARAYANMSDAGRKVVKGPLLVISGSEDAVVFHDLTTETVEKTCLQFPDNQIEYLTSTGTGHVPTLFSTRSFWMKWIEDRFSGKKVEVTNCGERLELKSFLPIERYQATWASYVQWIGAPEFLYQNFWYL